MPRTIARALAWERLVTLVAVLGAARPAHAQDTRAPYPRMAPIERYLMDPTAEIALARSAAPAAVSRDASVMVLGRKGYEAAVRGTNGFVCVVERSWDSPFESPEFWNPKIRSPLCLNPPAAQSILPVLVKKQELIVAGLSKAQVIDEIKAALVRAELPAPAPGSMGYMMSKGAYLGGGGNLAHVMVFEPLTDAKMWGAGLPGSTILAQEEPVERLTIFIVPVGQWSDGTSVLPR